MERTSEIEIPQAQAPPSEQGSLTKAWEPTSDVSTQLQRLIIAHKEGALKRRPAVTGWNHSLPAN